MRLVEKEGSAASVTQVIPAGREEPVNHVLDESKKSYQWEYTGTTWNEKIQKTNISLACGSETKGPEFVEYENNVLVLSWNSKEFCPEERKRTSAGSFLGSLFYYLVILFLCGMIAGTIFNFALKREPFPDAIPFLPIWQSILHFIMDLYAWVYERTIGNQYVRL